jgi:8-oxo-dGTP pyrophosphatase MutT (NUDIX family)
MMAKQRQSVDARWYRRPEGTPERISAGGVVVRVEQGNVLVALVHEVGLTHYVLPKGGLRRHETLEQAARREILEEAGLSQLEMLGDLGVRERLSYDRRKWIKAHYYLFATSEVEAVPTDSDHHYGTDWFPLSDLPPIFWPEQEELIESNRDLISRLAPASTQSG